MMLVLPTLRATLLVGPVHPRASGGMGWGGRLGGGGAGGGAKLGVQLTAHCPGVRDKQALPLGF